MIKNLLDNTNNQPSKSRQKTRVKVHNDAYEAYKTNSHIKPRCYYQNWQNYQNNLLLTIRQVASLRMVFANSSSTIQNNIVWWIPW